VVDSDSERKQSEAQRLRLLYCNLAMTDDDWTFMWLFDIAHNHYVGARVCLINGLTVTGCVLAHQCIETYLKAIARATVKAGKQLYYFSRDSDSTQVRKEKIWNHDLLKLTTKIAPDNPNLNDILSDDDLTHLLTKLTEAYDSLRYGEASYSVKFVIVSQWLDKIVSVLERIYYEKRGATGGSLFYVPECFRRDFLKENYAFTEDNITDYPFASMMMGEKLPYSMSELYEKARREAEPREKSKSS